MRIFSTCRDCRGLLHITDGDTVHPLCEPKPTCIETLAHQWLAAADNGDTQQETLLHAQIEEFHARPPRLAEAALAYAEWGWPVFPLKPRSKQPATPHGFKNATLDTERIQAWWLRNPTSNIGLPTGHTFDVIDIDVPDGTPTLTKLEYEDREVHGWVTTASGGIHLYITPTGTGCLTRWLPGTDYRGAGGYVVAPPSTLVQRGRAWSWLHAPSPILTGTGDIYGR